MKRIYNNILSILGKQFYIILLCFVLSSPINAAAIKIYSDTDLNNDKGRYKQKFEFLLNKGLMDFMTAAEKRALKGVVILHPLRGAGPLTFKATVVDGTPIVIAPVMTLKFIEDLSVSYAWHYQNKYSLEPMDIYLYMLKHRPAKDFPRGHYPDPMTALGVPAKIWEKDKKVDDLSLRFRNSAWAYILAHELGHLRYGHTQHTQHKLTSKEVQRQEEIADEFAVDLLNRSDTIPMGMILWFQATAGYMHNRSDFASDSEYFKWLGSQALHPVNGSRLRQLASNMRNLASAKPGSNDADVQQFIAVRLESIGKIIENPEMQRLLKTCATSWQPNDLKRRDGQGCF